MSGLGFTETDGVIKSMYTGIPLEFKYQIFKKIPLRTGLGVNIDFLLKSEEQGTMYIDTAGLIGGAQDPNDPLLQSLEPISEYKKDITGSYHTLDLGLTAKVEYEFKLKGTVSIIVFSKFNYGLTNSKNEPRQYDWKNYNLMLGIGLKI